MFIPLLLDAGHANPTFDAGALDAIDETAKDLGLTRSAFLASAAREKIGGRRYVVFRIAWSVRSMLLFL